MSKQVGPVTHNYNDNGMSMSTETRLLIEKEVTELLERANNNAKTILAAHRKEHHATANASLEHETLTGSQIKALLAEVNSQKQLLRQQHQMVVPQSTVQSNPVPSSTPNTTGSAATATATAAAAAKSKGIASVGS